MMEAAEHAFKHELHIVEELLGHPHPRHTKRRMRLAFTSIAFKNQKIGGIIMQFQLNKDTPSVQLLLQALDENGSILPDVDVVTGHDTLKAGSIAYAASTSDVVITQDPTNPKLITVSRANNVTSVNGSISAKAISDEDAEVDGTADYIETADPVVDTGIAKSLQFVPAPPATPAQTA